jgi:hypothetical protein
MSDNQQDTPPPIILDAGKQKRKRIKQLKRGEGKLAARVREAAEHVCAQEAEDGRDVIPVVLVFERRPRRP